ncbi:MAG: DEAD/DEAH box helicase [Caldilineae bacterium]|nr:MAG: DEAD/DEAH box helicase [Caldilineae bacterium]
MDLFEGLPRQADAAILQAEIVPNLPPHVAALSEEWLYDNLRRIQERNGINAPLPGSLEVDEGMVLEGAGYESWRYPNFTVEMETGTGKTYVYLRTIHELRQRYGFSKFIIVVPSIAIYEGVIKNFQITRDHFRALYGNETVNLVPYDGARLSQLRGFAASTAVEILVMTLQSFTKASGRASNVIFRPSEKLPGERLPIQYIQETRPILILDEPQNMESDKAKAALRTLHPLFALRYSATHRTSPNLVYRLTPFDAYRLNLVKKIQVLGVTERENFNQPYLHLVGIDTGRRIVARLRTNVLEKGRLKEAEITLRQGDDLFAKTNREEHKDAGWRVREIHAGQGFVEFENGKRLTLGQYLGPRREEIFRVQIRETIRQHMQMQQKLQGKGIKVLSLFFIDRVANYTDPQNGVIRQIFDEEFEKQKRFFPFYQDMRPEEVRSAYFAKKKAKQGEEAVAIDTSGRNKAEREAEKAAFELIMKDKERLLGFGEKTCFIFAHSALKEGWDNPNVFQICTLNQTVSEVKKRQEIGRGLRIAVNQNGERVFDEDVNILTVVANESYEQYASTLQSEYVEDGLAAPPPPTKAGKAKATRNDAIFKSSQAFKDFWAKLQKRITYQITLDTDALVQNCINRINNASLPITTLVVEKGAFVMTDYTIELLSVSGDTCKLSIFKQDTRGDEESHKLTCKVRTDLEKELKDERLRGYKIVEIIAADDTSRVVFGNGQILYLGQRLHFQSESGQKPQERASLAPNDKYPLKFNLLDRAARETGLTRPTILRIFKGLSDHRKQAIFTNPEGFAGLFITEIRNALANHIAERIRFQVHPVAPQDWGYDLEDLFPPEKEFPQKELIPGSAASLYDQVQIDSEVEKGFVEQRLNPDGEVVFYFKFPPAFKFNFPRVIGNYNPDWGIARYVPDDNGGKVTLELVRETKGQVDPGKLQFAHETRKVHCAQKLFDALGVDYRVVTDKTVDWWRPDPQKAVTQGKLSLS